MLAFGVVLGTIELGLHPRLALVLPKVLYDEGLDAGDREHPLAGGVYGEATEVARDPASVVFLGDCGGRTASAKAVKDEVSGLG
jgi:hypothetical protein